MTPKHVERLQKKISDVKRTLAAEKRTYGCYDESRGIRYHPLRYFNQLGDYSGGLKYLKWFTKNFPDDSGFPDYLFEWTIILYKTGWIAEAEKKAFQTFCSNTYIIDKYFGKPIIPIHKWEGSNLEAPSFVQYVSYSNEQYDLKDFSEWLSDFTFGEKYTTHSRKFVQLQIRLKTEKEREIR